MSKAPYERATRFFEALERWGGRLVTHGESQATKAKATHRHADKHDWNHWPGESYDVAAWVSGTLGRTLKFVSFAGRKAIECMGGSSSSAPMPDTVAVTELEAPDPLQSTED